MCTLPYGQIYTYHKLQLSLSPQSLSFYYEYLTSGHLSHHRFYFDFSASYVGIGMICPYIVNVSLLIGSILSWGIMWPLIANRKGDWYRADLPSTSFRGLQGYRVI